MMQLPARSILTSAGETGRWIVSIPFLLAFPVPLTSGAATGGRCLAAACKVLNMSQRPRCGMFGGQ